jgi:hypothetical protein
LQPAARAIFDVGIIAVRLAAIMPVVGCGAGNRGGRRRLYDLRLLLDDNWGRRYRNNRRISGCVPITVRGVSAIAITRRSITIGRRISIVGRVVRKPAVKPISKTITSQ